MATLALSGGIPVRRRPYPPWPVYGPEDASALLGVLHSRHWGGYPHPGPRTVEFETAFARFQGSRHCVLLANGTVALEVALRALSVGDGDEVIVPGLTFSATAHAVCSAGALPVFADVGPDRPIIDIAHIESVMTGRTRVIIPVHLAQHMADMTALRALCERVNVHIVEDCAHAVGQFWAGQGAGTLGDFGAFSHEATKSLTAGEGGTLTVQKQALADRARSIIDCGRPKGAFQEYTVGTNYRLNEFGAALLTVAVGRLEDQCAQRQTNAEYLESEIRSVANFTITPSDKRITRRNFWKYALRFRPECFPQSVDNQQVAAALTAEGIPCWHGYPAMHQYDLFQPKLGFSKAYRETAARMSAGVPELPNSVNHAATTIYVNECVFRDGRSGIDDLLTALEKLSDHSDELIA